MRYLICGLATWNVLGSSSKFPLALEAIVKREKHLPFVPGIKEVTGSKGWLMHQEVPVL